MGIETASHQRVLAVQNQQYTTVPLKTSCIRPCCLRKCLKDEMPAYSRGEMEFDAGPSSRFDSSRRMEFFHGPTTSTFSYPDCHNSHGRPAVDRINVPESRFFPYPDKRFEHSHSYVPTTGERYNFCNPLPRVPFPDPNYNYPLTVGNRSSERFLTDCDGLYPSHVVDSPYILLHPSNNLATVSAWIIDETGYIERYHDSTTDDEIEEEDRLLKAVELRIMEADLKLKEKRLRAFKLKSVPTPIQSTNLDLNCSKEPVHVDETCSILTVEVLAEICETQLDILEPVDTDVEQAIVVLDVQSNVSFADIRLDNSHRIQKPLLECRSQLDLHIPVSNLSRCCQGLSKPNVIDRCYVMNHAHEKNENVNRLTSRNRSSIEQWTEGCVVTCNNNAGSRFTIVFAILNVNLMLMFVTRRLKYKQWNNIFCDTGWRCQSTTGRITWPSQHHFKQLLV